MDENIHREHGKSEFAKIRRGGRRITMPEEEEWNKKHYNPFASVPVRWEVSPKWLDRKIRVRERKTSDWDYERYVEVELYDTWRE
jgi:hypothetical protein